MKTVLRCSHGFVQMAGKQRRGYSLIPHKLVRAVCLMAFNRDHFDREKERVFVWTNTRVTGMTVEGLEKSFQSHFPTGS